MVTKEPCIPCIVGLALRTKAGTEVGGISQERGWREDAKGGNYGQIRLGAGKAFFPKPGGFLISNQSLEFAVHNVLENCYHLKQIWYKSVAIQTKLMSLCS